MKKNGDRMIETFYNDILYKGENHLHDYTGSNAIYKMMFDQEFNQTLSGDNKSEACLNNLEKLAKKECQNIVNHYE